MSVSSTIPNLVQQIAQWFPDLQGRCIAVSDAEITKENMPTQLPLAIVGLQKIMFTPTAKTGRKPEITEDILVQFWMKPERYKKKGGTESPFWSYYDYDKILDRLVAQLLQWETPRGTRLSVASMDFEVDSEFAVILTFNVHHVYHWCAPDDIVSDVSVYPAPVNTETVVAFNLEPANTPANQPCACVPSVAQCPKCIDRTYP